MSKYSLAHLSEGAVLRGVKTVLAQERGNLALALAHLGEIEANEYFKPAGYSSMHMYCVHELHLSKDAAKKRIRAARLAREFPAIFDKVAEGALRLTSLLILGASLSAENVEDLLAAAAYCSDFEVNAILAERFPQAPVPTTIEPIGQQVTLAPPNESVGEHTEGAAQPLQGDVNPLQVKPIAADQYRATFTMSRRFYDKLRRLKDLLGYRKSAPDEAELMETSVAVYIAQVEKRMFGAPGRPRRGRRSKSAAHISAAVRGQVFERDGSRCTFTSEDGVRCPETRGLELDHIEPVARGGDSRPSNLRLRCRAHNQLEAERAFGKPFMQNKREHAKAEAAKRRAERDAKKAAQGALDNDDLMPALRNLGYSKEQARSAIEACGPTDSLAMEARLKKCLAAMLPPHRKILPYGAVVN